MVALLMDAVSENRGQGVTYSPKASFDSDKRSSSVESIT